MMSLIKGTLACLSLSPLLLGPLAIAPAQAQQSYPLTCRGGGNIGILNTSDNNVKITFRPAAVSAPQGLQPGECSWQDRAFRPGEPNAICDTRTRATQYISKLFQSNEYVTFQVFNNNQGCMQAVASGTPPMILPSTNTSGRPRNTGTPNTNPSSRNSNSTPGNSVSVNQFRPDFNQIWRSNLGDIAWQDGMLYSHNLYDDVMTITSESWDANQNVYVVRGTLQKFLTNNQPRSFEMTFKTACQFEGTFKNEFNRPEPWSGSCP
jgi:hypothetical protein